MDFSVYVKMLPAPYIEFQVTSSNVPDNVPDEAEPAEIPVSL